MILPGRRLTVKRHGKPPDLGVAGEWRAGLAHESSFGDSGSLVVGHLYCGSKQQRRNHQEQPAACLRGEDVRAREGETSTPYRRPLLHRSRWLRPSGGKRTFGCGKCHQERMAPHPDDL